MRNLSTLGYLLDLLKIPSVELARSIHVDASLVSKWKHGNRMLTGRSIYFQDIVSYLIRENETGGERLLEDFFASFYPDQYAQGTWDMRAYINKFLTDKGATIPQMYRDEKEVLYTAEINVYTNNDGRRKAINNLLMAAENRLDPCTLLTIDCEQFDWLVEDESYARQWADRVLALLERGFILEMIMHFTIYEENFVQLYQYCSQVLFHNNTVIYYHKYFDEHIYWFSFFILEDTMSVMGLSMQKGHSHSTVFTDAFNVIHHKKIVTFVKQSCTKMFREHGYHSARDLVTRIMRDLVIEPQERIQLYYNSQLPVILFSEEKLLRDLLEFNQVDHQSMERCLHIRRIAIKLQEQHCQKKDGSRVIFFLSREKIDASMEQEKIYCPLLSYLCQQDIYAKPSHIKKAVRYIYNGNGQNHFMMACFLEKEEEDYIPSQHCLCQPNYGLIILEPRRLKYSYQSTLLDTSIVVFEQAWRKIPPRRKKFFF